MNGKTAMSYPYKSFNRREMLGSLGLGATASLGFMMTQENATGKNPAADVVDTRTQGAACER